MKPEIFRIGNFSIRWYSVMILLGILIGYLLAKKESKKFDLPKDFIFDLTFWIIIFGIIGFIMWLLIGVFIKMIC